MQIKLTKRAKYAGDIFKKLVEDCEWDIDTAYSFLETIPDAKQEPERGYWYWFAYEAHSKVGNWHCDRCNRISRRKSKFCPNCGARMEVGDDNDQSERP